MKKTRSKKSRDTVPLRRVLNRRANLLNFSTKSHRIALASCIPDTPQERSGLSRVINTTLSTVFYNCSFIRLEKAFCKWIYIGPYAKKGMLLRRVVGNKGVNFCIVGLHGTIVRD
jgi:hypothetical protein